jgi:hypothetical protein
MTFNKDSSTNTLLDILEETKFRTTVTILYYTLYLYARFRELAQPNKVVPRSKHVTMHRQVQRNAGGFISMVT